VRLCHSVAASDGRGCSGLDASRRQPSATKPASHRARDQKIRTYGAGRQATDRTLGGSLYSGDVARPRTRTQRTLARSTP